MGTRPGFIACLFDAETGFIELRALPSRARVFIPADDHASIDSFVAAHPREDIYHGVCGRRMPTNGRAENLSTTRAIWADVDFSTTPARHLRARLGALPCPPSVQIRSGRGRHCYWLLVEPLNATAEAHRLRRLLRRAAGALGGDLRCAEPARVLRLPGPGCLNWKYQPARRVDIAVFEPDLVYAVEDLELLLPPDLGHLHDARAQTGTDTRIPAGKRNTTLTRLAGAMRRHGASEGTIATALATENAERCDPPLPVPEVRHIAASVARYAPAEGVPLMDDRPEQQSTTTEGVAFPDEAWRGPFAEYRKAMAGTTEAPDCVHFGTLWAIAAARLRRRVWIHYAYPHYGNVYVVNVGPTGDGKTSAMRQGLVLLPDVGVRVLRGVGSAEALGDWMAQSQDDEPTTHLLFLEELATLLVRAGWEGSTLLNFLTETFDTPDLYEIPFRRNPVRVIEPTPTLLVGTTPEWFWKSMREIDFHGGFGNRLFFLSGQPKAPIAMPAKPNEVLLQRVQDAVAGLGAVQPGEITLSPRALTVWEQFYAEWKGTTFDALTAAATKRIPAYALKLAMLYASFEGTAPVITPSQVESAIVVARYGATCAGRLIDSRRSYSGQGRCEEAVLRALAKGDLPLWRLHQRIGGRFSAEEMARAVRALLATGAIVTVGTTPRQGTIHGLRERHRAA